MLLGRLQHHTPSSKEDLQRLKARLADLAHSYCGTEVDISDRQAYKELLSTFTSLQQNKHLVISKPDKGSGVVLLNRKDYVNKMKIILGDTTKFKLLGPVSTFDRTQKVESKLQRRFRQMMNTKLIPNTVYECIRPVGSQRPRMYGLPKVHKDNTPMRPILAMIKSPQHNLAKWLNHILSPVLDFYSTYCLEDSFTFVKTIKNLKFDVSNTFWCSFDVKSLFTNIPLQEAIDICVTSLYDNGIGTPHGISKSTFMELIVTATSSVEFSFDETMYLQTDGVAMGSPLGPTLATIFLGYYERNILNIVGAPLYYCRYVDDTFAIFNNENECDNFERRLNLLHPSLQFTSEKENNNKLSFLDVLVEKNQFGITTDIYRKPTFTWNCMKWNSFSPNLTKIKLIPTLVDRAQKICSPSKLDGELGRLKKLFSANGYPDAVVRSTIDRKMKSLDRDVVFGPSKCPVPVRLPYIGKPSQQFDRQISRAVSTCFGSVQVRAIFTTRRVPVRSLKDALPTPSISNVIYNYKCHCGCDYVGRTSQSLSVRISQHVPPAIRSISTSGRKYKMPTVMSSSIGQHLIDHPECAKHYDDNKFSILAYAASNFQLSVLEAIFIESRDPVLCRQKKFVLPLKIFRAP